MFQHVLRFFFLLLMVLGGNHGYPQSQASFLPPSSDPQDAGLRASRNLATEVEAWVAAGRLVGAELLVLKNRQVVLHETFGWKDLETRTPMEKNTLFNIRSMTKPLIGLAAQILIDEGRCAENDRISRFLPEFTSGPGSSITIGHLLTHRSGLPLSFVNDFDRFPDLQAIAAQAARTEPAFLPGSGFLYSDTGSDLLALVVERAAGVSLEQFVKERVLDPLGMADTFPFWHGDDKRAGRIASNYTGGSGRWFRFWAPGQGPLYRFPMGSQSYYSTPADYARFLALMMDGGKVKGRPLISTPAWQRMVRPVSDLPFDHGFGEVRSRYGQMMQLLTPPDRPEGPPVAFGHSGSDGTVAWAWPKQDLMVLLFTQSRGRSIGLLFDHAVDRFLIRPDRPDPAASLYGPLTGSYIDVFGSSGLEEDQVLAIHDRLAIDIPSQGVFFLETPDAVGRFRLSANPEVFLTFERDENSAIRGLTWHEGGKSFFMPRRGTQAADELVEQVRAQREEWKKFIGKYRTEQPGVLVEVVLAKGGLAVIPGGQSVPIPLTPPDEQGRWGFPSNPGLTITFQENVRGDVVSFTAHLPDGRTLVREKETEP